MLICSKATSSLPIPGVYTEMKVQHANLEFLTFVDTHKVGLQ